jgi:uncharacterized membrane protein
VSVSSTKRPDGGPDDRHGVSARRRVGVAALVGAAAGGLSALAFPAAVTPLIGYDVATLVYLGAIWPTVWRLDAGQTARHADREDPTRAAADLMIIGAALVSLIAVGYMIVRAGSASGLAKGLQVALGAASVLLSWAVVHTVYALRYARLYYIGEDGGADFHQGEKPPRYSDFAYLSFTVGMTYQVSDTELNDAEFRRQVLRHSLLSYLFGTVIVALTINLVAGLLK